MTGFKPFYGGSIINGIDQSSGELYHVLTIQGTNANVIVVVDIMKKRRTYSQIMNLSYVRNLVLLRRIKWGSLNKSYEIWFYIRTFNFWKGNEKPSLHDIL